MAGGHTTQYTKKHLEYAKMYLEECKDTERKRIKTDGEKSTTYEFGVTVKLPSIEGLARYLQKSGLHTARSTIYKWKDDCVDQEFSDILEEILSEQIDRLINSSINGDYNGTIAKLLMGKHGYTEKTETEHSGEIKFNSVKDLPTEVLLKQLEE